MTDHVAMAESQLDRARREVPDTYSQQLLMSAQAHATLALVEQQRIANLIAMRQSDSDLIPDEDWDRVNAEIKTGLGL